jgi:hypothetical protein
MLIYNVLTVKNENRKIKNNKNWNKNRKIYEFAHGNEF